jgi:hypothetical protein
MGFFGKFTGKSAVTPNSISKLFENAPCSMFALVEVIQNTKRAIV